MKERKVERGSYMRIDTSYRLTSATQGEEFCKIDWEKKAVINYIIPIHWLLCLSIEEC